tara:strand:- start:499 stop:1434 length:936 start_codon:yes stop_codon:yes gene_type:complete
MKTLYVDAGNTKQIVMLREKILELLESYGPVTVKLSQPGIMYEAGGDWKTVVDFMNEFRGKPIIFESNLVPLRKCDVEFRYTNDMFMTGPLLYQKNKKCKDILSKLVTCEQKTNDKLWDLLLGEKNDDKDLLHRLIDKHKVKSKTFLTYYGRDINKGHWSVMKPRVHTAETIGDRSKTQIRYSDIIDTDIYNQTQYSAMIETVTHNDFAMFSEKEAKPIIAKRPFIIFGSMRHLEAFRSLGFRTFDTVIDESYDLIDDRHQRWSAALESMHKLSLSDPVDVYRRLADVLEHNKRHFETHDWRRAIKWDSYD